jgi:hypothetical protein
MMSDTRARNRWLAIVAARLAAAAGAVLGLILVARAPGWGDKVLGVAIVLSALAVMAIVPTALARRWRSGDDV